MQEIMAERYPVSEWNIYGAQASDGDNWNDDSPVCRDILINQIMPFMQYFTYVEITPREHQALWYEYEQVPADLPLLLRPAAAGFRRRHLPGVPRAVPAPQGHLRTPMSARRQPLPPAGMDLRPDPASTGDRARVAERYALDTYPNQIEVITAEQMMDAYARSACRIGYHHWSYGKHFLSTEKGYSRGQMGSGLRDRDQLRPVHRLPDGREHHVHAGPGDRPRLLRPQQLLQGQLPVPHLDRRQLDHRLPGVRQTVHHAMRGAPRHRRRGRACSTPATP